MFEYVRLVVGDVLSQPTATSAHLWQIISTPTVRDLPCRSSREDLDPFSTLYDLPGGTQPYNRHDLRTVGHVSWVASVLHQVYGDPAQPLTVAGEELQTQDEMDIS